MKSKYHSQLKWQKKHPEFTNKYRREHPEFVKRQNRKSTLRKYGLTLVTYEELLKKQKYCCAICGINQSECRRTLCVDHCHLTGKVRALLCDFCNIVIGQTKEDVVRITKILKYLKKHSIIGKTLKFDSKAWTSYYQQLYKDFN